MLSQRVVTVVFFAVISLLLLSYLFYGHSSDATSRRPHKGRPVYQRKIVAVGDLHADYDNMMTVLKMAKVISDDGNWTGNVDYLVQTGDIVDRGDDTIKMYRFLEKLRVQAQAVGGDIRSHLGNHEVMNLLADWRYVPQSEIVTFGGAAARQKMIASGWIGQAWRANYTITTRLPLHPAVGAVNADYEDSTAGSLQDLSHSALSFLHGGLSPTYKDLTPYPSKINNVGAMLVRRLQDRKVQPPPHPPADYAGLPANSTVEEHELYGGNGPLWYRGWAMGKDALVCSKIDAMLEKTGVKRFVMGHTPNFTGILSRCGGKIIIIDTGISKAYGGVLSAARFTYSLHPTNRNGRWTEQDVVTAIYPDHEETLSSSTREIQADFL